MLKSKVINSSLGNVSIRKRHVTGECSIPTLVASGPHRIFTAHADDVVILIGGKYLSNITDFMKGRQKNISNLEKCNVLDINARK